MKRINKDLITSLPFCAALLLCSAAFALAQTASKDDYPKVEVFVGYSALGEANSRGISFGANRSVSGNYSAGTDLKLRLSGTSVSISASRVTSRPISIMSRAAAPLPLARLRLLVRQSRKTFGSNRAFTIFWQARSLRRATAPASRHSLICSAVWRTRARLLPRRDQPSIFS